MNIQFQVYDATFTGRVHVAKTFNADSGAFGARTSLCGLMPTERNEFRQVLGPVTCKTCAALANKVRS